MSNPEEDDDSQVTPKKFGSSPASSSSTIENRRVNHTNVTSSSSKEKRLINEKNATTPISSKKKPSRVQKGSSSRSLTSVDHNKQYVIDAGQKDFDGLKVGAVGVADPSL